MKLRSFASVFLALIFLVAVGAGQSSAAPPGPQHAGRSAAQPGTPAHAPHEATRRAGANEDEFVEGSAPTEEHENDQFKHSPSVRWLARKTGLSLDAAYWLSLAVNFLIVAVIIGIALKANLPRLFRSRTESIQRALQEARRASEDAARRLAAVEERLSKMNALIAEMQAQAETDFKTEEQRIWATAEDEKRKIIESAQQEIAVAAAAARRELKLFAVELATANAEKQIKVDSDQDKQLIREFAEQLDDVNPANGRAS